MRITIEHKRTKAEVIESIDRSFDQMFQGVSGLPVRLVVEQKNWQGSVLTFALSAKMGGLSAPIKGTVEVTDHEVIVDADLGMLSRFVPEDAAQELIGKRMKGLLN
jgi:isocitrate dehydrogenase